MRALRRFAYAALGVAYLHLVFGAIVRISGSGMGCGDNWPKCNGYWIPPMSRPDLIIEVTHRYLASILILTLASFAILAWRRRAEPGVGGRGGVLRMAIGAVVLVFCVAGFGAVTVYTGNPPWATVTHWTLAMTLLAVLATAAIRAGALGGASARSQHVEPRTFRSARGAAAIAFIAVVFGGLTAKVPGGAVACRNFPLCGVNPDVAGSSVGIQVTHRLIALFLLLHVIGMLMAGRKRKDSAVVKRAVYVLLGIVLTQGLVAGAMIGMHLPPVVRSMHEAVGVAIWLSAYTLAYLARIAAGMTPLSDGGTAPRGAPLPPRTPMSGAGEQAMAGVSQMARPHSVAVFVARGAGGEA